MLLNRPLLDSFKYVTGENNLFHEAEYHIKESTEQAGDLPVSRHAGFTILLHAKDADAAK